jgi:hypothetical protein
LEHPEDIEHMKEEFDNELRELSPLLAYLKKEQKGDAFKVPKFYFDNLADKVIAQAHEMEKTRVVATKETPQYPTLLGRLQDFMGSLLRPRVALAFGSCLIVASAAWFMLGSKQSPNTVVEPTVATTTTGEQLPNTTELPNSVKDAESSANTPENAANALKNVEKMPNAKPNEGVATSQNSTKSMDTEGVNPLANEAKLTHPQSGLTEEELALYLEENTDENESDGSDNNL